MIPEIGARLSNIGFETIENLHLQMVRIRTFEEVTADLLLNEEIKCPTHLYIGQEAISAGVCESLEKSDYVFPTYRSHGTYLAKGACMNQLMAELFGKIDGCSKGKGGSMHVSAPEVGILGTTAIVSGNIPLAMGTALASTLRSDGRVTVVFFGDGATDEGYFYECLNFASIKKLPMVFICENNLFSTHLPLSLRQTNTDLYRKVVPFQIPAYQIEGNDPLTVSQYAKDAIRSARNGEGPTFLECLTFRWRAHVGPWHDWDVGHRHRAEVEEWIEKCPIKKLEKVILEQGIMTEKDISKICDVVKNEVDESVRFAKQSPYPSGEKLTQDVFKPSPLSSNA